MNNCLGVEQKPNIHYWSDFLGKTPRCVQLSRRQLFWDCRQEKVILEAVTNLADLLMLLSKNLKLRRSYFVTQHVSFVSTNPRQEGIFPKFTADPQVPCGWSPEAPCWLPAEMKGHTFSWTQNDPCFHWKRTLVLVEVKA